MIENQTNQILKLGTILGRKQALSALAGHCSAADAECLRQIRNQKQYRALGMTWEEFCKRRAGVTRATADKIIDRLEEFGPAYFILAQTAGVTPGEFRRISPAVRGQNLLHAGEQIPIDADHAPRLIAAVAELRGACRPQAAPADEIEPAEAKARAEIERAFHRASRSAKLTIAQFKRLVKLHGGSRSRLRLHGELGYVIDKLNEIEQAASIAPAEDLAA